MAAKTSQFLLLAALLLVSSVATTTEAFNITRMLDRFPNFSTFNGYLTQTGLYKDINSRKTITVLVVNNAAISSITGKPVDTIKRVLSVHVMLDYFDRVKIDGVSGTSIIATMFQASGLAQEMQGFLNITRSGKGNVVFRSTMEGGSPDAEFVTAVAAQPYNISVLQISRLIIAPGINMTNPRAASPSPAKAPVVTTSPAEAPFAESPTEDDPFITPVGSPADAPADAPLANAPMADPPLADAPVESMGYQASLSAGIAIVMGLIWSTT